MYRFISSPKSAASIKPSKSTSETIERFSATFKRHVTLNNSRNRYVRFQLDAGVILGFNRTSI